MHSINAFCGGPVIGKDEFKNSVYRNTAERIGMSTEDYRNLVAGELFDSEPATVCSAMVELARESRIDPRCANVQLVSPLKIPRDSNTPAFRQLVERINAFPGDRMMLGYSGGGNAGHWVALRRDTEGNWQNVNSLHAGNKPHSIENLGAFIADKTGVHLIHIEPDFSFDTDKPVTRTVSIPARSDPALKNHPFLGFATAARTGIDAARANVDELLASDVDTQTILRTLLKGDGGMRRGTTALGAVSKGYLKPEELPPHALNGTPEQWSGQTESVTRLAHLVANARFNEDIEGNFTQYGNNGKNPFATMANELPDRDRDVRAWLAQGLELTSDLIASQERAGLGLAPLTDAELNDLERRVESFCSTEARNERLPAFDADMGDAVEEINRIYEAGRTVRDT